MEEEKNHLPPLRAEDEEMENAGRFHLGVGISVHLL